MIGVAMGLAARERAITFSSTFAAFFTRTFDHLRMAAVSQTPANFCGSHCGVSIGELECAISFRCPFNPKERLASIFFS